MPHNWASAECILYLRHRLALEDGQALRLLAGITNVEWADREPMSLASSPTRFGRIGMELEPLNRQGGWRLKFRRSSGPAPERVELPAALGSRFRFSGITGAESRQEKNAILVTPGASAWEAVWKTG
jgi:hypothetical protein